MNHAPDKPGVAHRHKRPATRVRYSAAHGLSWDADRHLGHRTLDPGTMPATAGCWITSPLGQSRRCRQRLSTAGLPPTAEEPQPWPSRPESDRPQIAPERNTTSCNVLKERAAQERKSLS